MERRAWLREKRRLAEERMDTLFAPIYDDNWGAQIDPTHRQMVEALLSLCPPRCAILDAACGTGKYWPIIQASRRKVFGVDQAREMLARVRAKFPRARVEKMGLQEMTFANAFHGALCVDAMENVPPEDWPLVLANLRRALKAGGHLYLTVELAVEDEVRAAVHAAHKMKLPVVAGEVAHEGGYHYYPPLDQVRQWLAEAPLEIVEERVGDEYHHFLVRKCRA